MRSDLPLAPVTDEAITPADRGIRVGLLVAAGIWLLAEWVKVFVKPGGDFPNHVEMARRFLMHEDLTVKSLDPPYPVFWFMFHGPCVWIGTHLSHILLFAAGPLSIAAIIWSVNQLSRPLRGARLFYMTALAVFLASPFLQRDLHEVGVNTFLVALTYLAVVQWQRGRIPIGGALLGLACALKNTPLIFVAYFALKRQWRMVLWSLLWTATFWLMPILHMGPREFVRTQAYWAKLVVSGATDPDPSRGVLGEEKVDNLSLRPAIARYLMQLPHGHAGRPEERPSEGAPLPPPMAGYVQFLDLTPAAAGFAARLAALALVALTAWVLRHPAVGLSSREIAFECAAVSVLSLLISPITWRHHMVAVLPALLLLCREIRGWPDISRAHGIVLWAYFILCVVLNRGIFGKTTSKLINSYRVKTLAMLVLLGGLLFVARRCRASFSPKPPKPTGSGVVS